MAGFQFMIEQGIGHNERDDALSGLIPSEEKVIVKLYAEIC